MSLFLYDQRVIEERHVNYFTLLLNVLVIESIDGVTTTMLRWRLRCRAGDDGDHDGASEMEITRTR